MIHLFNGKAIQLSADAMEIVSIEGVAFESRMMVVEDQGDYLIFRRAPYNRGNDYRRPIYYLAEMNGRRIVRILRESEASMGTYRGIVEAMQSEIVRLRKEKANE